MTARVTADDLREFNRALLEALDDAEKNVDQAGGLSNERRFYISLGERSGLRLAAAFLRTWSHGRYGRELPPSPTTSAAVAAEEGTPS